VPLGVDASLWFGAVRAARGLAPAASLQPIKRVPSIRHYRGQCRHCSDYTGWPCRDILSGLRDDRSADERINCAASATADAGYVTVTPELRFEVSRRIKEEFENGRHDYALDGEPIAEVPLMQHRPDTAALAWHNENRFRG